MFFGSVRFFKLLIIIAILLFGVLILLLAYSLFSFFIPPERAVSPPMESGVAASEQAHPPETVSEPVTTLHTTAPEVTKAAPTSAKTVKTDPVTEQPPAGLYDALYPEMFCSVPSRDEPEEKTVYLTFDDGPSGRTAEVLDLLKEKNIKATFFVIGRTDEASADLMRRIVAEGHVIGLHSYSHRYSTIYQSVKAFLDDYNRIYQLVYQNTGVKPDIFRFPGGSVNDYNKNIYGEIIQEMRHRGFTFYDWNVDSYDTRSNMSADSIKKTVIQQISRLSRSIVLMHDSKYKEDTVAALGGIIDRLLSDGYRFDKLTSSVQPVVFSQ